MVNASLGSPLLRFGQINMMIMDELRAPCLDYKYDKMLEHIKKTSWDSDAAQGGINFNYFVVVSSQNSCDVYTN